MRNYIPHTIRIRIPNVRQVAIIGDFNNWHSNADPLVEVAHGVWERIVDLPVGRHRYAFFVIEGAGDAIRSRLVGQGLVLHVPEDPDQWFSIVRTDFSEQALVA